MSEEKFVIRGLLRHYWKKGFSAKASAEEICAVEGESVVHRNTAAFWFRRFNSGNTSLEDEPRSGRPSVVDDPVLLESVGRNPHVTTRGLAEEMGVSNATISRHLEKLGVQNVRSRSAPHDLSASQAQTRVDICKKLLENPNDHRFYKRIITSDEKWIFLKNPTNRKQWVQQGQAAQAEVRQDRFGKKIMLCVWWNYEGILHFELVPEGRAINAELYCEQLDRVYEVLKVKYPALINRNQALFQQDNAPAHRSRLVKEKFSEMNGISVLPHPPYSPDVAPSDYGLFRSMAHFLKGRRFENFDDVKSGCEEFFASKTAEWYQHQIQLLAERWVKVVENDGLYFEE